MAQPTALHSQMWSNVHKTTETQTREVLDQILDHPNFSCVAVAQLFYKFHHRAAQRFTPPAGVSCKEHIVHARQLRMIALKKILTVLNFMDTLNNH